MINQEIITKSESGKIGLKTVFAIGKDRNKTAEVLLSEALTANKDILETEVKKAKETAEFEVLTTLLDRVKKQEIEAVDELLKLSVSKLKPLVKGELLFTNNKGDDCTIKYDGQELLVWLGQYKKLTQSEQKVFNKLEEKEKSGKPFTPHQTAEIGRLRSIKAEPHIICRRYDISNFISKNFGDLETLARNLYGLKEVRTGLESKVERKQNLNAQKREVIKQRAARMSSDIETLVQNRHDAKLDAAAATVKIRAIDKETEKSKRVDDGNK